MAVYFKKVVSSQDHCVIRKSIYEKGDCIVVLATRPLEFFSYINVNVDDHLASRCRRHRRFKKSRKLCAAVNAFRLRFRFYFVLALLMFSKTAQGANGDCTACHGEHPKPLAGHQSDEPMGGRTLRGNPVSMRLPECFPAENRDLFWQMDAVASGPAGQLEPLNFDCDGDGKISNVERAAVQGRNTWLLWAGGNEAFWGWLQENGFGLVDFLILIDSRFRGSRFEKKGLINQPGMTTNRERNVLGLYIDKSATMAPSLPPWLVAYKPKSVEPDDQPIWMTQPVTDRDETGEPVRRVAAPLGHPQGLFPADHAIVPVWNADGTTKRNSDGSEVKQSLIDYVNEIKRQLPKDGVDYSVYGYPSGVVGLRLFLNPDFFANTRSADKARRYWYTRISGANDPYYTESSVNADPKLVRPLRVGMSCAFCHVGPHPLSPPGDMNEPQWYNLSSIIGGQYWRPQSAFGNLLKEDEFLYHFLNSQQPGTIDTSLISTDQINNANTINAVFDIPARLLRAAQNPPEEQSSANLRVPSIEEGKRIKIPRHTPRILLDGSDSIGAFGALARVYLNIGTFWEEWKNQHNAIIGFRAQKPFLLEACQANSVYWQTNEKYRVGYLAAFFTLKHGTASPPANAQGSYGAQNATGPMKLRDAKGADGVTPSAVAITEKAKHSASQRLAGRKVWLENCAICHSSKQPDGFALAFAADWKSAPQLKLGEPAKYTLPLDAMDWEEFITSDAYQMDYLPRLYQLVRTEAEKPHKQWLENGRRGVEPLIVDLETDDPWDTDHLFWSDNFLSTDIRVPVSLVGTNSGRALATNGMKGEIWDNFTSTTYKQLPPVGRIHFYNLFSNQALDDFDKTNDSFKPPAGGRGYYRPASHIALWATAPFLHNNSLGVYILQPSVEGRLTAYNDAIRRLLWFASRSSPHLLPLGTPTPAKTIVLHPGDLRSSESLAAIHDPGYIYRLPQDTSIYFAPGFIRPIVQGVVGLLLTEVITVWMWVLLFFIFLFAAYRGRPRHAGAIILFIAILMAVGVVYGAFKGYGETTVAMLTMGIGNLLHWRTTTWWFFAIALACVGVAFVFVRQDAHVGRRWTLTTVARVLFTLFSIAALAIGWTTNCFVNGRVILHVPWVGVDVGPIPIHIAPIPRGTPVNLLMNIDPESRDLPKALASMFAAIVEIKTRGLKGEEAWTVLSRIAGPNLLRASKCQDFVLDRGHNFGEKLTDAQKEALIGFLETL